MVELVPIFSGSLLLSPALSGSGWKICGGSPSLPLSLFLYSILRAALPVPLRLSGALFLAGVYDIGGCLRLSCGAVWGCVGLVAGQSSRGLYARISSIILLSIAYNAQLIKNLFLLICKS